MDKKQVIVISLLVVAIILSTASVMMNVSVLGGINIQEAPLTPDNANVAINIQPTGQNVGGAPNELG